MACAGGTVCASAGSNSSLDVPQVVSAAGRGLATMLQAFCDAASAGMRLCLTAFVQLCKMPCKQWYIVCMQACPLHLCTVHLCTTVQDALQTVLYSL